MQLYLPVHINFPFLFSQHATATPWAPSSWPTARRVTLPTGTASANPEWVERTATGVWWATGAFTSTAAAHVTAQENVTRSPETACSGEFKDFLHPQYL